MRLLPLALLVACLPVAVQAQGLGAAAANEKQKRQRRGPAGAPAFNDRDLSTGKRGAGEAATGEQSEPAVEPAVEHSTPQDAPAASAPAAAEPKDRVERDRHERALSEADWRVRFANARERLRLAEADSWREVVRTEFRAGVPVPMRIKEQVETEQLTDSRRALAELEEEFRRTGLPAGWARQR